MSGRLDSLSSSDFQTYYDKLGGLGFDSIRLDMNRLTYISSTGLRVIMHMVKDVGQGNVSATGISDNVMDILNVTGFNTLLKM
jgi:anti-anti-sigma factor